MTKTFLPQSAFAQAPGKVILAGEQFVVLGAPAVAMAINLYSKAEAKPNSFGNVQIGVDIPLRSISTANPGRRVGNSQAFLRPLRLAAEATLSYVGQTRRGVDVNVACKIPIAAGLGSSASTTVAIIAAVAGSQRVELTRKEIFRLAFIPEKFLHGKPSGVDQATCIYGGTIEFTRPSSIKPVEIKTSPVLLLCDSGIHHETRTLVGSVVKKSQTQKDRFQTYLTQAREISRGVSKALRAGDSVDLGFLMSLNHGLLKEIGVSHPKLDRLVFAAKRAGALGAKLTGAGGGGCIIAVCPTRKSRERIAKALRRAGGTPISVSRDNHGVRATNN